MHTEYDERYFKNGKALGISNYEDYRWLPERTLAFAKQLCSTLEIKAHDRVLDYGCARGYTVKALRMMNVDAWGYDISKWAIENCDDKVKTFVHNTLPQLAFDYILSKDVFEHLTLEELQPAIKKLLPFLRKKMLVIVPLSRRFGEDYVRTEDNQDITHVIKWPLNVWMEFFQSHSAEDFTVTGSWHLPGLKPTSYSALYSCGFITVERVANQA